MARPGLACWSVVVAQQILLLQCASALHLWDSGLHRTRPTSDASVEHLQISSINGSSSLASITLVITINSHIGIGEDMLLNLHALHEAYAGIFGRIVFTGQARPPGLHAHVRWTYCEHAWGYFVLCHCFVMAEFPQPPGGGGFLFIGDDAIFDPCRLARLDPNKFWTPPLRVVPYTPGEPEDGWAWWWLSMGGGVNTTAALAKARDDLPWHYKERFKSTMGEEWAGLSVHHTPMDFIYVPAWAAADWIHLTHHFWHHSVMGEASMPIMAYFLAGHERMEMPMGLNVIDLDHAPHVELPPHMEGNSSALSDADATEMLRIGMGIVMPREWHREGEDIPREDLRDVMLTWWHAYKMQAPPHRRQAFHEWWRALPCLQAPQSQ